MSSFSSNIDWRRSQHAQQLSNRTIKERCRVVDRLASYLGRDPASATSDEIVSYFASLDVSRTTAAGYHSVFRAYYLWLVRSERRDDNPMNRVIAPKPSRRQPRPVTDRELAAILGTRMHFRTRVMILLACLQGLRVHEIAKIRGDDINVRDMLLSVAGKGDTLYTLPLHPVIADLAAKMPSGGYWFSSHTQPGRHVRGKSVTNIVSTVFLRAGVKPGAHRLRHWYATRLLADGANIRVVQELMRHASLQSTQIYTQVEFDQQRAALERLGVASLELDAA